MHLYISYKGSFFLVKTYFDYDKYKIIKLLNIKFIKFIYKLFLI